MTTSSRITIAAVLAAFWLAGCQPAPKPEAGGDVQRTPAAAAKPADPAAKGAEVTVFVPCGMIDAFRAVEKAYPAGGGDKLKVTYDNAVVLLKKIRAGERPDVLVSPGRLEMKMMEEEKYVDAASVVNFGTFKMIVVTPKNNPAGIQSYKDLTSGKVGSVGVADPAQNSVGEYAVESLKKIGMYDQLDKAKKIRSNWHALTVVEWVCAGKIDAGIYYDNCPFTSGPTKLEGNTGNYHIVGEMPTDSYSRIQVQAGRLLEGPNQTGADKFITWLMSAEGQKLLNEKGVPSYDAAPSQGGKQG